MAHGPLVREVPRKEFAPALKRILKSRTPNRAVFTPIPENRQSTMDITHEDYYPGVRAVDEIGETIPSEPATLEDFEARIQKARLILARAATKMTDAQYRNSVNYLNTIERAVRDMMKGFKGYHITALRTWLNPPGGSGSGSVRPHTDNPKGNGRGIILTKTFRGPSTTYYTSNRGAPQETPDEMMCGHIADSRGAVHSSPEYKGRARNTLVLRLEKVWGM